MTTFVKLIFVDGYPLYVSPEAISHLRMNTDGTFGPKSKTIIGLISGKEFGLQDKIDDVIAALK